jgi:cell division protein FtsB
MVVVNKQLSQDIDKENKQLEKYNGRVVSLKKKNALFEKRLAKLTQRDFSITVDEHIEKIRRVTLQQYFTY